MGLFTASGILCFGPSTLATAALILSIFANSRCNLFKLDDENILNLLFPVESVGLWCYEATNGNNYDTRDYEGGSKFESARALGTTTLVIGWVVWIFYLVAGCKRFAPRIFQLIGLLCVCNAMFQGLVFLVLKADICEMGCSLDTGGKCAISAVVLWFFAGTTSCASGKELEAAEAEAEAQGE